MPLLTFNDGDEVRIARTASEYTGEEGEVVKYLGTGPIMRAPGQDIEQTEAVPRWLVQLIRTGAEVAFPESDGTLL